MTRSPRHATSSPAPSSGKWCPTFPSVRFSRAASTRARSSRTRASIGKPSRSAALPSVSPRGERPPREWLTIFPYARRAARALGVELEEVTVGPATMDDLASMVWQLDEPQADLAPLNVGLISQAARAAGIKVLLSGAGGDDIFSGYRRHQSLQLEPVWSWLPRPARGALRGLSQRMPTRHPAMRRAVKVFGQAHRTPDERIASYFYWLDPEQGDSLVRRRRAA